MVDKRAKFTAQIIDMIDNAYGREISIFREIIPHTVRAAEASATGNSIFKHDPTGKVAAAYDALALSVCRQTEGGVMEIA